MTDSSETKTCGMCCMAIPVGARKCPYCQHFQSRLAMVMYHPGFAALAFSILLLAVVIVLGTVFQRTFDQGENFQLYSRQISVSDTTVQFGQSECGPTVAVLGRMKNDSNVDWKEVQFHVEFRNSEGKLMDVSQQVGYSYYLPAHQEAGFKVSFRREFPEESYACHSVRVMQAKDAKARF